METCGCGFTAKEAGAQGVKRGNPRPFGRHAGAEKQIGYARLHLLGGFVGESDRENGFGGDALRNEMRHAIGDGAGLAGARARENENGAFSSFRCKTLLGVQSLEKVIHWSVRSKICCAQSW